ncbi:hypothetical protein ACFL5O_01890 [Myxococcota bacterium]
MGSTAVSAGQVSRLTATAAASAGPVAPSRPPPPSARPLPLSATDVTQDTPEPAELLDDGDSARSGSPAVASLVAPPLPRNRRQYATPVLISSVAAFVVLVAGALIYRQDTQRSSPVAVNVRALNPTPAELGSSAGPVVQEAKADAPAAETVAPPTEPTPEVQQANAASTEEDSDEGKGTTPRRRASSSKSQVAAASLKGPSIAAARKGAPAARTDKDGQAKKADDDKNKKADDEAEEPKDTRPANPSVADVASAIGRVRPRARACLKGDASPVTATVTFGSDGRVENVAVSGKEAGCISKALRGARISPFSNSGFTVSTAIKPRLRGAND